MLAGPLPFGRQEVSDEAGSGSGWSAAIDGREKVTNSYDRHSALGFFFARVSTRRLTTKFSDRAGRRSKRARQRQFGRAARSPAAEHFMVGRLAETPSWAARARRADVLAHRSLVSLSVEDRSAAMSV